MEYCIGIILGLVLGLSGAGGSVFGVPLIILFLGRSVNEAIVTALGTVMLSAIYGTFIYRKDIQPMPALVLGFFGMLSAPLGRIVGSAAPEQVLLAGFCMVSIIIALIMWYKSRLVSYPASQPFSIISHAVSHPYQNEQVHWSKQIFNPFGHIHLANQKPHLLIIVLVASGIFIGFISGLFGLGGGVLLIPLITYLYTTSMRVALATSLLSIVMVSMSGFVTSFLMHDHLDMTLLFKLVVAGVIGMLIGHTINDRVSDRMLQKVFCVSLISMSLFAAMMAK
jgi:hypothetical protein